MTVGRRSMLIGDRRTALAAGLLASSHLGALCMQPLADEPVAADLREAPRNDLADDPVGESDPGADFAACASQLEAMFISVCEDSTTVAAFVPYAPRRARAYRDRRVSPSTRPARASLRPLGRPHRSRSGALHR